MIKRGERKDDARMCVAGQGNTDEPHSGSLSAEVAKSIFMAFEQYIEINNKV